MSVSTPVGLARLLAVVLMLASATLVASTRDSAPRASADHGASVDIRSKNSQPPRYPAEAVQAGAEGTVRLRVDVDASGRLTDVVVVESSGSTALDAAAIAAARSWTYAPAMRDGAPAAGHVDIPVDFRL